MSFRDKKTVNKVATDSNYASAVELCSIDKSTNDCKKNLALDATESNLWGCQCLKPRWLQWLNDPKWFLFFLVIFATLQGMSINTFVNFSIPSIEKQFSFNSKQTGFIAASNEITSLLFVPFISFYGGYSHKARLLGCGGVVTGLGTLLFVLPRFLIGAYDPRGGAVGRGEFCSPNTSVENSYFECHPSGTPSEVYFAIFVLSQLLAGAGACPLFTLGPAFLDENVRPKYLPIYLGFLYSSIMLGPGIGATVGGKFLSLYVDLKQPPGMNLTEKDPRWLGAWWLGCLVAGFAMVVVGVILLGYPRELPGARAIREEAIQNGIVPPSDQRFQGRLRDILPATRSLLGNAVYMFQNLAVSVGSFVVAGVGPFFFKITQGRYGLKAFVAGLTLSFIATIGGCGGFALGSFVVRRLGLRNSCEKAAKWSFLLQIFAGLIVACFLIPGCENSKIAGVHTPYYNSTLNEGSLNSVCNSKCHCTQSTFNPVRGPDNILYFSPCHAGCTSRLPGKQIFVNCSCVRQSRNISERWTSLTEGAVRHGMCDRNCKNFFLFAVGFTVAIMISFSNAVPSKTVTLRSVADNQRPLALGLQFVFQRSLGMLPGPIVFGHMIDSTCQVWRKRCGERSSCADYDYDKFSNYIVALGLPMLVLSLLFYFLSWRFCKKSYQPDAVLKDQEKEKMEIASKEKELVDSESPKKEKEMGSYQEIELEEERRGNVQDIKEGTID